MQQTAPWPFELEPGESVALLGPSGCGKSTLLRRLLGLVPGEAGALPSDGLGVAFQLPGLFDARTIAENLGAEAGQPLPSRTASLLEALALDGLPPEQPAGVLSGGERKRLAIARALLLGNRLVVLDEPTSGLDHESIIRVAKVLRAHRETTGAGLLFVTHHKAFAAAIAERILWLQDDGLTDISDKLHREADPEALSEMQEAIELTSPQEEEVRSAENDVSRDTMQRAAQWKVTRILSEHVLAGLGLSLVPLLLLGILLSMQTAAESPVDMSPHIPGLVVTVIFRELAPLVVGLLLAARIGARLASELAGMGYTAQLDTMRVLGFHPDRLLALPAIGALAILFPALILIGAIAGVFQGGILANQNWYGLSIGGERYAYLAREAITPLLMVGMILKGILMGMAVGVIAYLFGSRPIFSAPKLGEVVTQATMCIAVSIVGIDLLLSALLYT